MFAPQRPIPPMEQEILNRQPSAGMMYPGGGSRGPGGTWFDEMSGAYLYQDPTTGETRLAHPGEGGYTGPPQMPRELPPLPPGRFPWDERVPGQQPPPRQMPGPPPMSPAPNTPEAPSKGPASQPTPASPGDALAIQWNAQPAPEQSLDAFNAHGGAQIHTFDPAAEAAKMAQGGGTPYGSDAMALPWGGQAPQLDPMQQALLNRKPASDAMAIPYDQNPKNLVGQQ